jgi:hypothetical protein
MPRVGCGKLHDREGFEVAVGVIGERFPAALAAFSVVVR